MDEARRGPSRRTVLSAVGAGGAAAVVVGSSVRSQDRPAPRPSAQGDPVQVLATHVHGSWSEGRASWEQQFTRAAAAGIDVLYLTDHDHRLVAADYATSLTGAAWVRSSTGSPVRVALETPDDGSLRLAATASAGPASATVTVQPDPFAKNRLRTSISGLTIEHQFAASTLDREAVYEIRVDLSRHPAGPGRPEGLYALVYRFGDVRPGRTTQDGGLTGVVSAPLPGATTVTLVPEEDVAAIWPSMHAPDNGFFGLSFTVRSPDPRAGADVRVAGVRLRRARSTREAALADQEALVAAYGPSYPGVWPRLASEIGRSPEHFNPLGIGQYVPDYALDTPDDHDAFHLDLVSDVHASGGAVSLNHALGFQATPQLPAADQTAKRRATYSRLASRGVFGVDLLEVAYANRGQCSIQTHLQLWDTFSRNGFFLTGNGASDDHGGNDWLAMVNGFTTGVWAERTDAAIVAALRSGRAFFAHPGRWPGGSVDVTLDDGVPMGRALVTTTGRHRLTVHAPVLPPGGSVEVLRGPVDDVGAVDPGTSRSALLTAGDFAQGRATVQVSAATSRFFRVQVRDAEGAVVGGSNPVWLLRSTPSRGIPVTRQV